MTRTARTMLAALLGAAFMSPPAAPVANAKEAKSSFGEMKRKCSPFDVVLGTLKDALGSSNCSYFGADQNTKIEIKQRAEGAKVANQNSTPAYSKKKKPHKLPKQPQQPKQPKLTRAISS